ncbi:hypothetical protein [Streptomyces sp. NPDC049887]|uniref:hypothetical protein n=1 Tax=unclassified Streptomyces TaxID=2593676 RepID=UPI00343993A8
MGQPEALAEGAGPFTTRLTWRLAEGGLAVWESRPGRKRGVLGVRAAEWAEPVPKRADRAALARLGRLNVVASWSFAVGGALFALGAGLALRSAGAMTSASVYFVGGLFFTTGAYASLLQATNAPRPGGRAGTLESGRWRWWRYEPRRIDWVSTFVLFAGTLVFGVNLLDSFLHGLTAQQANRLVWAPDMIGCLLFLVSGQLALMEVTHGPPRVLPHDLGWWIVAVNQLGSALFMIAALADFTVPATGALVNTGIADWGTLTGAVCFCVGGVLQAFERP